MKKNLCVLLMTALLVLGILSLTGCGKSSAPQENGQAPQEESQAEEPQASQEEHSRAAPKEQAEGTTVYPLTVTDSLGNSVTIEKRPQRIISLSPSNTETLFALGAGDRMVGRTDYCSYPEEAAQVESIGTFRTPNVELILSREPDVIFASDYMEDNVKQQIEATGTKVIIVSSNSIAETREVILLAGQVLDLGENAAALTDTMDAQLTELKETLAARTEEKSVFVDLGSFYSAGPGSLLDDMLNQIGAVNIAADTGETWPQLSVEAIIEKNPDIYLSLYPTPEEIKAMSGISGLDCVKNDRIIFFEALSAEGDIIQRPGPRVVEGTRILAEKIYPELF